MVALSAAANFTVCRTVLDGYTIHKQAVYRAVVREQVSALGPGQFANRTVKGNGRQLRCRHRRKSLTLVHRPLKHELTPHVIHRNHILRPKAAFQQEFADRILDVLLNRPLQWPRAVRRIKADFG